MVAPKLDADIEAAAQMSSTIENSGQCTAMRHLVTDSGLTSEDLKRIFEKVKVTDSSAESLRQGAFDGLFRQWAAGFHASKGYEVLASVPGAQPLAYRIANGLTENGLEEHWRRVYLDVSTAPSGTSVKDPGFLEDLSKWLTKEQPITLAVNGDDEQKGFPMMQQLFQSTAQAIYSVGREGKPALTAQARPQDGEIFGEFPPRSDMHKYTSGPVFVPSSTPTYMARYEAKHLMDAALRSERLGGVASQLLQAIDSVELRGYGVLLAEYLKDSWTSSEWGKMSGWNLALCFQCFYIAQVRRVVGQRRALENARLCGDFSTSVLVVLPVLHFFKINLSLSGVPLYVQPLHCFAYKLRTMLGVIGFRFPLLVDGANQAPLSCTRMIWLLSSCISCRSCWPMRRTFFLLPFRKWPVWISPFLHTPVRTTNWFFWTFAVRKAWWFPLPAIAALRWSKLWGRNWRWQR